MNSTRSELPSSNNQCNVCGKHLKRRRDVYRHKRTHIQTRQRFLCKVPECDSPGFSRKDDLQRHMRYAHHMQATKGGTTLDEVQIAYKQSLKEHKSSAGCIDLLSAADIGSLPLVESLLGSGADITTKSEKGLSILHLAAAGGYVTPGHIIRLYLL